MKHQIATDKNQSSRLLSAGVKAETADMSIDKDTDKLYLSAYQNRVDKAHEVPAWSLSALIGLLPESITNKDGVRWLRIRPTGWLCFVDYYADNLSPAGVSDKDLVEATVQMIELLAANGYQLNQTEI